MSDGMIRFKAEVKRKGIAWKDVLRAKDEIVRERCKEISRGQEKS